MGSITNQKFSQASSAERKKTRQKQYRRTKTLMKKAFEVSRSCEADVFFGVRMKNSGHIYTFCADSTGIWSFISSQLESYYPIPDQRTPEDFAKTQAEPPRCRSDRSDLDHCTQNKENLQE